MMTVSIGCRCINYDYNNPGTNVSNLRLNADGSVANLQGFSEITSAQDDERQFRFGLRISF